LVATERAFALARAGDDEAFRELTEPHRRELHVHCYRLLGSVHDAEDVLQETLLAAWRGLERFEGRASVRGWLFRIATNRCLNALRARRRRQPEQLSAPPFDPPEPTRREQPLVLEPYPDALLDEVPDVSAGPEARYETRESIQLAFIAALQCLPPRQRASLVLRDVLGFSTGEVARVLDASEGSVKGALQRARATLQGRVWVGDRDRAAPPPSDRENAVAARFADAFQNDDIDSVVSLLAEDAWLEMPPYPHAYRGPAAVEGFLRASAGWRGPRRYVLLPTRANAQPAFACYLRDAHGPAARAAGLIVLGVAGDRLTRITRFMDTSVFGRFGVPETLAASPTVSP
jgi:RNA polymerase sigma-70 factor (TIGR02960 family)